MQEKLEKKEFFITSERVKRTATEHAIIKSIMLQ